MFWARKKGGWKERPKARSVIDLLKFLGFSSSPATLKTIKTGEQKVSHDGMWLERGRQG